jgi:hypothetical protein
MGDPFASVRLSERVRREGHRRRAISGRCCALGRLSPWVLGEIGVWCTAVLSFGVLVAAVSLPAPRRRLKQCIAVSSVGPVVLLVLAVSVLAEPVAHLSEGRDSLRPFTIGSRDGADYGAGAELILRGQAAMESGFFSQREVHQIEFGRSIATYWTEFNHFGAAAILAGARERFRLLAWQALMPVAIALGALFPLAIYLVARRVFGFRAVPALVVGLLSLLSVSWRSPPFHGALGQMLGTFSIAFWLASTNEFFSLPGRRGISWETFASVALAQGLVLGVYQPALVCEILFLPLFCIRAWNNQQRVALVGWSAALAFGSLLFLPRALALGEVLAANASGAQGWDVPFLGLPALVGWVEGSSLRPLNSLVAQCALGGMCMVSILFAIRQRRHMPVTLWVYGVIAVFGVYFYTVVLKGCPFGSYKAYKLYGLLAPVLFVGGLHFFARRGQCVPNQLLFLFVRGLFVVMPAKGRKQFCRLLESRPDRLATDLIDLPSKVRPGSVDSITIQLPSDWERIWASVLLVEHRQYFAEFSYATRGTTERLGSHVLRRADGGFGVENLVLEPASPRKRK